jgi:uncharacterized repeat protein (TIGR01451 family)
MIRLLVVQNPFRGVSVFPWTSGIRLQSQLWALVLFFSITVQNGLGVQNPLVIATPLHDTVQVIAREQQYWEFQEQGYYSWHTLRNSMFLNELDTIRTLKPTGKAKLRWRNMAELYLGPGSKVGIGHVKRPKSPDEKKGFWGWLWMSFKRFSGTEPSYWELFNVPVNMAPKGTEFLTICRQRIAYVNGNDLWLMFDDGTGKTNFIAAPPSQRIGRSTFSPDGGKVAYEVWTSSGCNLWTADGNGQNAQLLLSAGSLSDDTGHPGYVYRARRLAGPSFSPDGTSISFLRIQEYQRGGYILKEKEICTLPISGGSVNVLWKTMEIPGGYTDYDIGENTCWLNNGNIAFIRSGKIGVRFSAIVDATDTNKSAWPCEVYVEYDNENGRNPANLSVTVDGQNALPPFAGYGEVYATGTGWQWFPFPENSGWLTPQMGAYYGPFTSHDLTAGKKNATLASSDGRVSLYSQPLEIDVTKGGKTLINQSGNYYAESSEGGVWLIHSGGGAPYQLTQALADSVSWNSDASQFFIDYDDYGTVLSTYLMLYDDQGKVQEAALLGAGTQSSVGNWDLFDQRIVAWHGTNSGNGSMKIIDVDTGDVIDLGPGKYPVFVPSYRVEVSVFEGEVGVKDTNVNYEVAAHAGMSVTIDSLANNGLPQASAAIRSPYVTNVIPAWGSSVPSNSNVTVCFQFSIPVVTNSVMSNELTCVSWPGAKDESAASFAASDAQYSAALLGNTNVYRDAASNVTRRGLGLTSWNANATEFSIVITNTAFSRASGYWCEVGLDLSGVRGTNGSLFPFNAAETLFQFMNSINASGGVVESVSGGKISIPAGALSSATPIGISYSRTLAGRNPPLLRNMKQAGGDWKQASGVYTFEPTAKTLSANATIYLPVAGVYPDLSIWYFNGSSWSNLGGAYNSDSGTLSVAVNHLGVFAAFYQTPSNAFLRLTKATDSSSASASDTIKYSLKLENLGAKPASNTVVTDVLPALLSFVTNSAATNAIWNPETKALTWSLATVATGNSVSLNFDAVVLPQATYNTTITNIAAVSATGIGSTNSNTTLVRVGLPAKAPRLGAGGLESTNWVAMAALRSSWRRVNFDITTTQARNTNLIAWSFFDAQVRSNQAVGIYTYAIVNARPVSNEWPSASEFAAAFGLYVQRYNGDGINDMPGLSNALHHWEIFDVFTPNSSSWTGCTLSMYDDYLAQAHALAHGIDPEVTILSSAIEGGPATIETNYLQQLIAEEPWALDAVDAISVHDFWAFTPTSNTVSSWMAQYLEAYDLVTLRNKSDLGNKPYWFSKVDFCNTYGELKSEGYICSQTDNACFLARSFPYALAMGVDHIIYREMNRGTNNTELANWASLLDTNNNRRMSYYVLQKMIEKLEGFSSAVPPQCVGTNIIVKFLNVSNQPIWVVWNWSNQVNVLTLPIGPVDYALITSALPMSYNNINATWSVRTNLVIHGLAAITVSGTPVYVEAMGWVNPDINGNGIPNDDDSDMDGDGMSNDWEITQGLDPFVNDALDDVDHDGLSNIAESHAGTDPHNPGSLLRAYFVTPTLGVYRVDWQSVSGKSYRIQWSCDCRGAWSNAADGLITAVSDRTVWCDSGPPKTAALTNASLARFYRIKLEP